MSRSTGAQPKLCRLVSRAADAALTGDTTRARRALAAVDEALGRLGRSSSFVAAIHLEVATIERNEPAIRRWADVLARLEPMGPGAVSFVADAHQLASGLHAQPLLRKRPLHPCW